MDPQARTEQGGNNAAQTPAVQPENRSELMAQALQRLDGGDEGTPEPQDAAPDDPPPTDDGKPADDKKDESQTIDRSWAALDRRDRELLAREQRLKDELSRLGPMAQAYEQLSSGDKVAALKSMGIEPTSLAAEFWSNDKKDPEVERQEALEQRLASQDEQLRQQGEMIRELLGDKHKAASHRDLMSGIEKLPDLEVTQFMTREVGDAFLDQINAAAKAEKEQFGADPDLSDLLQRTEAQMTDNYKASIDKLLTIPKLRAHVMEALKALEGKAQSSEPDKPKVAPKSPAKQRRASLTNDMQGEPPVVSEGRSKTRSERRARALHILQHGVETTKE